MFGYSSIIRKSSAFSFIMLVHSSNPSCSKQFRPFVHDKKSYQSVCNDTDKHEYNIIIRMIYKCLKKYTFAFYLFDYIVSYSMPMI